MKISSSKIPELSLQSINIGDASHMYVEWLNDPLINQYLETRFYKQDMRSVKHFITAMIDNTNEHLFTIRQSTNNNHVGNIKIGAINTTHNIGEVSLFIGDKGVWGKGFATKSIQLISRYAFEVLNIRKLSAGAYKPNVASTKAFLKAGYNSEGILTDHYLLNGQPCDLVKVCLFDKQITRLPAITIE